MGIINKHVVFNELLIRSRERHNAIERLETLQILVYKIIIKY